MPLVLVAVNLTLVFTLHEVVEAFRLSLAPADSAGPTVTATSTDATTSTIARPSTRRFISAPFLDLSTDDQMA